MKMCLIGLMFDVATCRLSVSLKCRNKPCKLCVIGFCTLSIVHPSPLYPNVSNDVADEGRAL